MPAHKIFILTLAYLTTIALCAPAENNLQEVAAEKGDLETAATHYGGYLGGYGHYGGYGYGGYYPNYGYWGYPSYGYYYGGWPYGGYYGHHGYWW